MAGVILERYIKAKAQLDIARDLIVQSKKLIGDTTIDRQIKREFNELTEKMAVLDGHMQVRMGKIRAEFHDAMADFVDKI